MNTYQRVIRPISIVGSLLLLTACSVMPEQTDYADSISNEISHITFAESSEGASEQLYLTDLIDSPSLKSLLAQAFINNPSLQQMLLTLQMRQAQFRQTNANRLPQFGAGISATREQDDQALYDSSLTISWQTDVWGKLAADSAAATKDIHQQQFLTQATRDTLAAEIMQSWLNLTARQHAITIEQKRLSSLEQNEVFISQRYRQGLGELEDMDNARSSTSKSRATLVAYHEDLRQQQRELNVLLGSSQGTELLSPADYPSVQLSLADLPEQTLNRRPDLQAAFTAIEANQLRSEVSYKNLLPEISLSAALADVAASPTNALFVSPLWSLLGQLTAPIFQGGQLRAEVDIAELEAAYSYQQYRETLLTAVKEVEQAISVEKSLIQQQQHIQAALKSARSSLTNYQQKYRSGLSDILDLLTVQQQSYDLEAQLDNLLYQQLSNRISLGLAIGLGVQQ